MANGAKPTNVSPKTLVKVICPPGTTQHSYPSDSRIGTAYGKWLGVRGILRAIEARTDEWTPTEWAMLERIDWPHERFTFPGAEAFDVELTEPGAH